MQERISLRAQIYWLCWEICTYPLNKAPPKTLKHQLTVMLFCRQRRNDNSDIMTVTMNHHSIITDAYYLAVFCWRVLPSPPAETVFLGTGNLYFSDYVNCISLPLRFSSCYHESWRRVLAAHLCPSQLRWRPSPFVFSWGHNSWITAQWHCWKLLT